MGFAAKSECSRLANGTDLLDPIVTSAFGLRRACAAASLMLAATDAAADAPAPYFFLGFGQLVVGNTLIGVLEGWLIARVFRVSSRRSILWMIAANYASSWIGVYTPSVEDFSPSLYDLHAYLLLGIAAFFVLTVVVEWPFAWMAVKGTEHRFRKSWVATLLAQTASYALLVPLYWAGSYTSLLDDVELVRTPPVGTPAVVYYISADEREIRKQRLDGAPIVVADVASLKRGEHLHVEPSGAGSSLDLFAGATRVATGIGTLPQSDMQSPYERCPSDASGFTCVTDLRSADDSGWKVKALYGRGLRATSATNRLRLELETPFLHLAFRSITALPADRIVFEVVNGSFLGLRPSGVQIRPRLHQICLLDLHSRKLAVIAEGREPLVVLSRDRAAQMKKALSLDKALFDWRARQDLNPRPPGS